MRSAACIPLRIRSCSARLDVVHTNDTGAGGLQPAFIFLLVVLNREPPLPVSCAELIEAMASELRRLKAAGAASGARVSAAEVEAAAARQKLREAEELERRHMLLQVWPLGLTGFGIKPSRSRCKIPCRARAVLLTLTLSAAGR